MMKRLSLATALTALMALPAVAQDRVSIGTGGTGGVFYAVGAGMADLLSRQVDGVSANAEVTGASVENIRRVSAGEMTMGFSSASTLYEAKNGQGVFDGDAQNVAAIAYLYPAVLQIAATQESGAASATRLAGRPGVSREAVRNVATCSLVGRVERHSELPTAPALTIEVCTEASIMASSICRCIEGIGAATSTAT